MYIYYTYIRSVYMYKYDNEHTRLIFAEFEKN